MKQIMKHALFTNVNITHFLVSNTTACSNPNYARLTFHLLLVSSLLLLQLNVLLWLLTRCRFPPFYCCDSRLPLQSVLVTSFPKNITKQSNNLREKFFINSTHIETLQIIIWVPYTHKFLRHPNFKDVTNLVILFLNYILENLYAYGIYV